MTKARKPKNRRPLAFESLEARQVLTSFGVPWPEAHDLTLSFAPDGTEIGSQTNQLFQTLDHQLPTAQWQEEILRAFQTWAVETNVNIGLVSDGGQPAGTLGLKQGDPRFGDIRIGAFPMAGDVLAVADPYDPFVANTWVGDVFLNSNIRFEPDDEAAAYDLFSVLLHEAGHVFGLPHSPDPASPMYEQFHQLGSPYLTPADVTALQALYGARSPDAFDASGSNDSLASATPISLADSFGQSKRGEVQADITSLDDKDVFRLVVPSGVNSLAINLEASGISLLVPNVTILNAAGDQVALATATDPLHNNLVLSLKNVSAGDTYYVKVQAGQNDVFGIGSYRLQVNPDAVTSSGGAAPAGNSYPGNPAPTPLSNAADSSVLELTTTPGYVEHTYYETDSMLTAARPVQTYRVRSADLGAGITNVMTVLVETDHLDAKLRAEVFDDRGDPVAATTIYQVNGRLEIQIPSVQSDRNYFVKVSAASGTVANIDYEFTVDFDADTAHLETYVNDSLSSLQPEVTRTLTILQSQQFHFVLSASDWNNPAESGVEMAIVDAGGGEVFDLSVADGSMRSRDVFLNEGDYTVRFSSPARSDSAHVTFELSGLTMSEPIGPQLRDTTLEPIEAPVDTALSALTFYWLPGNAPKPSNDSSESLVLADAPEFRSSMVMLSSSQLLPSTLLSTPSSPTLNSQEGPFENAAALVSKSLTGRSRQELQKPTASSVEADPRLKLCKRETSRTPQSQASQPQPGQAQNQFGFRAGRMASGPIRALQPPELTSLQFQLGESAATDAKSDLHSNDTKTAEIKSSETIEVHQLSQVETEKVYCRFVAGFAVLAACLFLPARSNPLFPALRRANMWLKTFRRLHKRLSSRAESLCSKTNVGQSGDWAAR